MRKPQVVLDEEHERVFERVAAVDVAKASGVVCVRTPGPPGGPRQNRIFDDVAATTGAITELGRLLVAEKVQMVTMDATSDYWRIWYCALEMAGLAVQLVSPHQARQLPGRPKTDKLDAIWLARLTEWGLLRPCFVPPGPVRRLRDFTRARAGLVGDRTRCRAAAGETARGRPDQGLLGGQQADHALGAGHDPGADRRGTRPAGPGRPGPRPDESHAARTDKDTKIRNHVRQLQALGLTVTITPAA